jgi:hypothetical protein
MIDLAMAPGKKTAGAKCNMIVYIPIIPLLPAFCFEDIKKSPVIMPEALAKCCEKATATIPTPLWPEACS